jgi:hypothetical protein
MLNAPAFAPRFLVIKGINYECKQVNLLKVSETEYCQACSGLPKKKNTTGTLK